MADDNDPVQFTMGDAVRIGRVVQRVEGQGLSDEPPASRVPRDRHIRHLRVTGSPTGSLYPAVLVWFTGTGGSVVWGDVPNSACWACVGPGSSGSLTSGTTYDFAQLDGFYNGKLIWSVNPDEAGGASSFTYGNTTTAPTGTVPSSTTTAISLKALTTSGVNIQQVSSGDPNDLVIQGIPAGSTQEGVVTTTTQAFGGTKTFIGSGTTVLSTGVTIANPINFDLSGDYSTYFDVELFPHGALSSHPTALGFDSSVGNIGNTGGYNGDLYITSIYNSSTSYEVSGGVNIISFGDPLYPSSSLYSSTFFVLGEMYNNTDYTRNRFTAYGLMRRYQDSGSAFHNILYGGIDCTFQSADGYNIQVVGGIVVAKTAVPPPPPPPPSPPVSPPPSPPPPPVSPPPVSPPPVSPPPVSPPPPPPVSPPPVSPPPPPPPPPVSGG